MSHDERAPETSNGRLARNDARTIEIADALATVRTRIVRAAQAADRDPAGISLIVVTKTRPASDIEILASLGARDIGENRHQEAAEKAATTADLGVRWHFIGHVQSNKAAKIATYAHNVHAVDSAKLVQRLDHGAQQAGRELGCFIQVNLDPAEQHRGRGGAEPHEVPPLADLVARSESLRLCGLMGIAPLHADPVPAFDELARLSEKVSRDHPGATGISAGMSADFEDAIRCGATHVRIGALILGERPPLG